MEKIGIASSSQKIAANPRNDRNEEICKTASKSLKKLGEFGLIERLRKRSPLFKSTLVGIGDDAAVLAPSGQRLRLLSTDTIVEGVDFSFRSAKPEEVGRKALAINLSDMAAMGARPEAALVALVVPASVQLGALERFHDGMAKLAREYRVSLAGGDLSSGPCWVIAVSIYGTLPRGKVVLRTGARPGDWVCVSGNLGGSILRKHLTFTPRIPEGEFLARAGASAMIDISDGLLQDLGHVLRGSKASADLWLDQIPVSRDALCLSGGFRQKALEHALTDGEDFELLFTIPPSRRSTIERAWKKRFRKTPFSVIGVVKKALRRPRIFFWQKGRRVNLRLKQQGFRHFT